MAGWLFLIGYLFIVAFQVRRAVSISEASFEDGLWWQRIEQISSAAIPQNLVVLAPATASEISAACRTCGGRWTSPASPESTSIDTNIAS